ncbi:unnamed protein product, partial [Heterotrigona itama]
MLNRRLPPRYVPVESYNVREFAPLVVDTSSSSLWIPTIH